MNYKKILDEANRHQISLPTLANKIGISKTALYKTISGQSKSMKIETLEKISDVLGVSITTFLDVQNENLSLWKKIESQQAVIEYLNHKEEEMRKIHEGELKLRDDIINKQLELIEKLKS